MEAKNENMPLSKYLLAPWNEKTLKEERIKCID
jgi:hypothetical protein